MEREATSSPEVRAREWPRAAALFFCVLILSTWVVHAGVLIAVPLLLLLFAGRPRGLTGAVVAALAVLIVASGARDGIWYAERAWSVLIGGGFLAITLLVPRWRLASRALGAVLASLAVAAGVLAVGRDAWSALDGMMGSSMRMMADSTVNAMSNIEGGGEVSPAVVTTLHQWAEAQAVVYPALVALASMAALGVAWWARTRLRAPGEEALAPLRDFRFNDHLVWVLVAGLLLIVAQWGDALVRLGSNAVVFMGVLYALRGAAVFVFISGGLSLLGYVTFLIGFILAAPVVLAVAMLIGIGDTWLDLRARASENKA